MYDRVTTPLLPCWVALALEGVQAKVFITEANAGEWHGRRVEIAGN